MKKTQGSEIPALSIQQPWAWAIMAGLKPCENRGWSTKYRGRLAIHAGKSTAWLAEGTQFLSRLGLVLPAELQYGALLGTVELIDDVDVETARNRYGCGEWASGERCWIFRDPKLFDAPRPMRGQQRLFRVSI